jgi:WD40 repeat protein
MKQNMRMLSLIAALLTIISYIGITKTVVAQSNVLRDFVPDIEYNPTYELVAIARTDDVGIYTSNLLLITTLPRDPNSRSRPGVAWRPDGLQLAMINSADIIVWDYDPLTNSFTQNTTIQPFFPVYSDPSHTDVLVRAIEWQQELAVTYLYQPTGLNLLPGVVALFDTQTWTTTTVIENPDIFGDPSMFMLAPYIATSPSGGQLLTSNNFCRFIVLGDNCEFPEVLLADLATEQIVWQYETLVDVFDVAWSPDSSRFAISADEVFIFDATTRNLIFTWTDTIDYPTYIEWGDDNQRLLRLNEIGEGQILDTQSYTVISNFQIDVTIERIRAIEWNRSTDSLFVGTNDSMIQSQYTANNCTSCIVEVFRLIDIATGDEISQLNDSDVIDLAVVDTAITIRTDLSLPVIGSVVFNINGTTQTDDTAPYEFTDWTPAPGQYTLTATPYSGADGTGIAGIPLTINFTVESP